MTLVKYANRKLYLSKGGKYVTLPEAAALIQNGYKVTDFKTKDDVTAEVLSSYVARSVLPKLNVTQLTLLASHSFTVNNF